MELTSVVNELQQQDSLNEGTRHLPDEMQETLNSVNEDHQHVHPMTEESVAVQKHAERNVVHVPKPSHEDEALEPIQQHMNHVQVQQQFEDQQRKMELSKLQEQSERKPSGSSNIRKLIKMKAAQ